MGDRNAGSDYEESGRAALRTASGYWSSPWTEDEVAYLRERYPIDRVAQISAHLNRSASAIYIRASQMGLQSRQQAGKNSLVPDYFRDIDTPMKAYLLGLLLSDGTVSRAGQVVLALHEKDIALVELARDEIAPGARIGHGYTRSSPMCRFLIQSRDLAADLARHGVVPNKTLVTSWPPDLPTHLENSFTCGYFDGDGSLHPTAPLRWAVVSGTREFLVEMQRRILVQTRMKIGGPYQDRRHNAAWSIVATGEPVRLLDAWMHRDVAGLARKRL